MATVRGAIPIIIPVENPEQSLRFACIIRTKIQTLTLNLYEHTVFTLKTSLDGYHNAQLMSLLKLQFYKREECDSNHTSVGKNAINDIAQYTTKKSRMRIVVVISDFHRIALM